MDSLEREILDNFLENDRVDMSSLVKFRESISLDAVQERYAELTLQKDVTTGKKLYSASNIVPSGNVLKKTVGAIPVSSLPLEIACLEDGVFEFYNQDSIDTLLKSWSPLLLDEIYEKGGITGFPDEISDTGSYRIVVNTSFARPLQKSIEIYKTLFEELYDYFEEGKIYSFDFPIYQAVNVIGMPTSPPFVSIKYLPEPLS